MTGISLRSPHNFPEVKPGDDIGGLIVSALAKSEITLVDGDILALAHKVVSKAEGQLVQISEVVPSKEAMHYAALTKRDPRILQLVLSQSTHVLHYGVDKPFVCRHKRGLVCANAGVDCSNAGVGEKAVLLPKNPDQSADRIKSYLAQILNVKVGVIICDTHGRPLREGSCGIAIGLAGVTPLKSYVGESDRYGREMHSSIEGTADELAAAATLLMGQGKEGRPLVIISGCGELMGEGSALEMIRSPQKDMFLTASSEEEVTTTKI